jgi:hypothetical protein
MLVPVGGARSLIMQATGNTKVEGELFFGRAARIGYDEAKGLVVLVGEPGAEALLSTWDQPGDPPRQYKGPHLGYYLKTGDIDSSFGSVEINGLRGFNRGNLLPSGGGKR